MADLTSLMMFAKIADAGSFSRAAESLQIPTSTMSRRIAELESDLGIRLLERSTRRLRITEVGSEILGHARHIAEISESVDAIVSNRHADVSGFLRLSAPPSLSDTLLAPLLIAFQASYPSVRVEIFVTERFVDLTSEGVDMVFRIGAIKDSCVVARPLLRYRHQLVASQTYLATCRPPKSPQDLLKHRLLAFSRGESEIDWRFSHVNGIDRRSIRFRPELSMNDFSGIATALVTGGGICDLPPVVLPHLLREGQLVEVMTDWRFDAIDLSIVHLANRYVPRPVRVFNEFVLQMAPKLFPTLPT